MVPKSDGTPNTALEAMSCRTPLIMGDLKYDKKLFGGTFLKVNLTDVNDLTNKIILAIESPSKEMIERGYENVERYGNRVIEMEKLRNLYLL